MPSRNKVRVAILSPKMMVPKKGLKRIQPGLGMMYLAACLEERGYTVFCRDTALEGYHREVPHPIRPELVEVGESDDDIAAYLREIKPHYVAITVLFSNLVGHMSRLAALAKRISPKTTVVIGGNYVSERYREILENNSEVDFAMINECDFAFADFIDAHSSGKNYRSIPGIVYREGAEVKVNLGSNRIDDLSRLPMPARHLVNMKKYWEVDTFHNPYSRHPRVGNVMTTRGCPEKCTFCTTPLRWGQKVRQRSVEHIENEIRHLKEHYGVGEIQFEDDTITVNYNHVLRLCDAIQPLNMVWNCVNGIKIDYHAKNKDRLQKMFDRMGESGCYQVSLGLETGNQDLLDNLIQKNLDLKIVPTTVEAVQKAGISCHLFLIVGFPGETVEQMNNTVELAKSLNPDSCSIAMYTPLPGTPLFNYCRENGYLVDGFHEESLLYAKSNVKMDGLSPEEFEKMVGAWNMELNLYCRNRDPEKFNKKYVKYLNGAKSEEAIFKIHN